MNKPFVNAVLTVRIPLDAVEVTDEPGAKLKAATDAVDGLLGDSLFEDSGHAITVGWEDAE